MTEGPYKQQRTETQRGGQRDDVNKESCSEKRPREDRD